MKIYVVTGYHMTIGVFDNLKAAVDAADNGDNDWNSIEVWDLNGKMIDSYPFDEAQHMVETAL